VFQEKEFKKPQQQQKQKKKPKKHKVGLASHAKAISLPDQHYYSIGDLSKAFDLKPHVFRYWENAFPQLSPKKWRGRRRYYNKVDIELVKDIYYLIYVYGHTIEGAKLHLESKKSRVKAKISNQSKIEESGSTKKIHSIIFDLENLLSDISFDKNKLAS
jgi:DNA-binding transcriptional MerR regulator